MRGKQAKGEAKGRGVVVGPQSTGAQKRSIQVSQLFKAMIPIAIQEEMERIEHGLWKQVHETKLEEEFDGLVTCEGLEVDVGEVGGI